VPSKSSQPVVTRVVLLRAVFGATEQWRTHKQRFYFETCTLMGMLA
jgi:hypothetical protein